RLGRRVVRIWLRPIIFRQQRRIPRRQFLHRRRRRLRGDLLGHDRVDPRRGRRLARRRPGPRRKTVRRQLRQRPPDREHRVVFRRRGLQVLLPPRDRVPVERLVIINRIERQFRLGRDALLRRQQILLNLRRRPQLRRDLGIFRLDPLVPLPR